MPHSSAEWRLAIAQVHCSRCGLKLQFLEGPLCDLCVAAGEVCPPGGDKYVSPKARDSRDSEDDSAEESPLTPRSHAPFAVDLVTGEFIR